MTDETGWLIEWQAPDFTDVRPINYVTVNRETRKTGFSRDANDALRFARKKDAEDFIELAQNSFFKDEVFKGSTRVAEHMWPDVQSTMKPCPCNKARADEAELARKDAEIAGLRNELEATRKAAKRGMDAAIAGSASRLRTAIAIEASTHPEMVESEREANARLTDEVERLQAELARLRAQK